MKILQGSKARLSDMKALWLEAFPEDGEFVDVFFEKFYSPSRTLLRYNGTSLVSMLYWMDVKIKYKRRVYRGAYLYGVATALTERGFGHFSALHETFLEKIKAKGYKFALTLPASDDLFPFYHKLGYTSYFRRTEYEISSLNFEEIDREEAWERHLAAYKRSKKGLRLLESREMFLESVAEHRFLGFENGYFAFVKKNGRYVMYDVCDPDGASPPYELVHYGRSAVVYDLGADLPTFGDWEKPTLNYLMN